MIEGIGGQFALISRLSEGEGDWFSPDGRWTVIRKYSRLVASRIPSVVQGISVVGLCRETLKISRWSCGFAPTRSPQVCLCSKTFSDFFPSPKYWCGTMYLRPSLAGRVVLQACLCSKACSDFFIGLSNIGALSWIYAPFWHAYTVNINLLIPSSYE